jgi:hypothetical protein
MVYATWNLVLTRQNRPIMRNLTEEGLSTRKGQAKTLTFLSLELRMTMLWVQVVCVREVDRRHRCPEHWRGDKGF